MRKRIGPGCCFCDV